MLLVMSSREAKVLVVDDCGFNILAVMNLLNEFNLSCDTCNDGLQAIDLVKARSSESKIHPMYEMILMDYSMPECNGIEATKEIRSFLTSAGDKQPYICCLTAYSDQKFKDAAMEAGMDNLLVKPIFYESMKDILNLTGELEIDGEILELDISGRSIEGRVDLFRLGCTFMDRDYPRLKFYAIYGLNAPERRW